MIMLVYFVSCYNICLWMQKQRKKEVNIICSIIHTLFSTIEWVMPKQVYDKNVEEIKVWTLSMQKVRKVKLTFQNERGNYATDYLKRKRYSLVARYWECVTGAEERGANVKNVIFGNKHLRI